MTGWLLSFVPSWVWILTGAAATIAAWFYLGTRAAAVILVVAALFAAYETGVRAERTRGEAVGLRSQIVSLERQQAAALDIQTRMAESMAALRADQVELESQTDALIDTIRAEPAAGACTLSDARRMRLKAIRIGPRAHPAAR